MVGLYGAAVGLAMLAGMLLIGGWLTWISLRSDQHTPAAQLEDGPN